MPSVKDFKNKQQKETKQAKETVATSDRDEEQKHERKHHAKRRPGRDEMQDVKVVDVEEGVSEQLAKESTTDENEDHSTNQSDNNEPEHEADHQKKPQIEIQFFGSELIRSKLPKPFEVAEKVATDWVYGGDFKDIPIGNSLAEKLAEQGLNKAKEIEKKVLESPLTEKVMMQALTLAMKFRRKKKVLDKYERYKMVSLGPIETAIRSKIEQSFNPSYYELVNESHSHSVPKNSETHFKLVLVSDFFIGISRVDRQRKVQDLLQQERNLGLHALTMRIMTSAEWDLIKSDFVMASPECRGGSKR